MHFTKCDCDFAHKCAISGVRSNKYLSLFLALLFAFFCTFICNPQIFVLCFAVIFAQRNNYRKQNRKYLRYFLHRKYYGSYMHLGGNGITMRSVEKKKSFEPPIQENCANKSRGDTLTQMLLAVICAELLPPVGLLLLIISYRTRGL